MVRNYVKKKDGKPKYSEERLKLVLEEIRANRITIHKASVLYGIPFSTLYCRIKGTRGAVKKTKGRSTAISSNVENVLATSIKTLAKWGFGLGRKEILELVGQHVIINEIKTPFKDRIPGEDWFLNFKKRHNLSIRKPEPLEYARKKAATDPFIIYGYFNLLQKTLIELDLQDKPDQIWNLDENSLSIDPSRSKVVGEKGQSTSRVTSTSGRENTTFVLACNAAGRRAPPLIIYKGKNLWDSWKASPDKEFPGTGYAATLNGWMETGIFKSYFEKTLIPALGDERPVLVIYDGHSTHVSLDLVELALAQGITILKLPAHTSDVLQPLDVAVFKSFKQKWDQTVATWQRKHVGQKLPKSQFSQFLGETWLAVNEDVIKKGFEKTGIYPFNQDVVPRENFPKDALERWEKNQESNMTPPADSNLVDSVRRSNTSSPSMIPPADSNLVDSARRSNTSSPSMISVDAVPSILQTPETVDPQNLTQQTPQENSDFNEEIPQIASLQQLILSTIQQKYLPKQKRRKVASGAEVITSAEMLKILKDKQEAIKSEKAKKRKAKKSEKAKKGKTTKKSKNKKKKMTVKSDSDKTDADSEIELAQAVSDATKRLKKRLSKKQNVKKQPEKKGKKRAMVLESDSDTESSDDIVSYAESDASEFMEEEIVDEEYDFGEENYEKRSTPNTEKNNTEKTIKKKRTDEKVTEGGGTETKKTEEESDKGTEEAQKEMQEPIINKWVIVKYTLKKGPKYYVGVIQDQEHDRWVVKFVRRKGSVFAWPITEDIDHVTTDSIIKILPNPEITKRGIISFDFKFRDMIIS